MEHIENIESLIRVLARSESTHGLFIKGPPGIGKSTCVEEALKSLSLPYVMAGTYSSPLGLYNALSDVPHGALTVIDDAGGLFQGISLDVLKAALAPSAGTSGARIVEWQSTAQCVKVPSFEFDGKIIILTNWFPETKSMRALIDRCFSYKIEPTRKELSELLSKISEKEDRFPNREAVAIALKFLLKKLAEESMAQDEINLRALNRLYEIVDAAPESWERLAHVIFSGKNPDSVIGELSRSGQSANRQAKEFSARTGLSERTFWNRRKKVLGAAEATI